MIEIAFPLLFSDLVFQYGDCFLEMMRASLARVLCSRFGFDGKCGALKTVASEVCLHQSLCLFPFVHSVHCIECKDRDCVIFPCHC